MKNEQNAPQKTRWVMAPELPQEVFAIWHKPGREFSPVAIAATTDSDGTPRTAPFASLHALTPRMLRLCSRLEHDTYANLCRDGRVGVALLSPDCAVSVRGHARVIRPQMKCDLKYAVLEIDIEEVKNDLGERIAIDSGITVRAREQDEHWFDAILAERDAR